VFYAFGVNQYNMNNKASKENNDCVHAEVDCVTRLKKSGKINHISLIVFRTNNKGDKLMNAKPCQNCVRTINFTLKSKNYILKKLCYSDEHGELCVYSDE
jgi:deoxycytidylate deaminase